MEKIYLNPAECDHCGHVEQMWTDESQYACPLCGAWAWTVKSETVLDTMLDETGFTLLESVIAMLIAGILTWGLTSTVRLQINIYKKLQTQTDEAQQILAQLNHWAASNPAQSVYLDNTCQKVDSGYWAKKGGAQTANIYGDKSCNNFVGTMNVTNNSTFFNDPSDSLWVASVSGTGLRIVVISFDIFDEGYED